MSEWEYRSLPDLSSIVETQPIRLDIDSRVRGICQLMDQVSKIDWIPISTPEDVDHMIKQFDRAVALLDRYLSMGESFLRKYRDANRIGDEEMRRDMSIMKKKRREVIKTLIGDYACMGLPQVRERVYKKVQE